MPNKLEVLTLFEQRKDESLDYKLLMEKFDLAADAAFHWLSRLHKQGLIRLTSKKGKKFYTLTGKGSKRLKWLRRKLTNEKKATDLDWIFDSKPTRRRETAGSFLFGKE